MLRKQEFIDIMNRLKQVDDFVNETNNKARELNVSDFFNSNSLSIHHKEIVIKLLENMFNDKDILAWWIYDLDYGRKYKNGCITEHNGDIIDISTAEKLYDYLIKNM